MKPDKSLEPKEVPEMNLDELRTFLVNRFGSLSKAFDSMDFFRDGQLSAIEWREGVFNTVQGSFGTDGHKYRMAIVPRRQFNARMQHLFALMDENCDGLINFDEFSRPYLEPEEGPHAFFRRRNAEKASHGEEKKVALQRTMLTGTEATRRKGPPAHYHDQAEPNSGPTPIRDFAVYIMKSFKDVNVAFAAFDVAGNGQLNLAEFLEGARRINYGCNAKEIFELLDEKNTGTISKNDLAKLRQLPIPPPPLAGTGSAFSNLTMANLSMAASMTNMSTLTRYDQLGGTKKDATILRKINSGVKDPAPHKCGLTLTATDIRRPMGESMRTASMFYTIPRTATGRMDFMLHANQLPGEDPEQFSAEHGPGFVSQGPEYFPYMGMIDHPRRGDKWKMGATMNREKKFGPIVPSKLANDDRELSAMSFCTYEGRNPSDRPKICNTGGISWSKSPVRPGITIR